MAKFFKRDLVLPDQMTFDYAKNVEMIPVLVTDDNRELSWQNQVWKMYYGYLYPETFPSNRNWDKMIWTVFVYPEDKHMAILHLSVEDYL
jgi:hypothetical protein